MTIDAEMRLTVVWMSVSLGLVACHTSIAYLNADELAKVPATQPPESAPCNELQQLGEEIDLRGSNAPAPTPTGGNIGDGIYVLTSSTLHGKEQADGAKLVGMGRITMLVNGPLSQVVRTTVKGSERRATVRRLSAGTMATLDTICTSPSAGDSEPTAQATYTTTVGSFQLMTQGAAGTVVSTYTKL